MSPRTITPADRLRGDLRMPSDKSIAHRALLANSLAGERVTVGLHAPGDDVRSTVRCLRGLGVGISEEADGEQLTVAVDGGELLAPVGELGCGNSGTTMRLLSGALAGAPISAVLDGDDSLRRRPMERLARPLRAMGAYVETDDGRPPIRIEGRRPLCAATHRLDVASAQLIGALSLAALAADGETRIESPGPTRDHTERLLGWMGADIRRDGGTTVVRGPATLTARSLQVPGDPSSAAAWLVAGALHSDAQITVREVGLNPTRLEVVEALREMGASIELETDPGAGPEPVGSIRVRGGAEVRPLQLAGPRVAALIDELPLLAVAMAAADGTSELRDAGELRVKESDRIRATVALLAAIGAEVEELADGWRVRRGRPLPASMSTHGDHRIAIAAAVAGICGLAEQVTIDDADCASVSYPTFWRDLDEATGRLEAARP